MADRVDIPAPRADYVPHKLQECHADFAPAWGPDEPPGGYLPGNVQCIQCVDKVGCLPASIRAGLAPPGAAGNEMTDDNEVDLYLRGLIPYERVYARIQERQAILDAKHPRWADEDLDPADVFPARLQPSACEPEPQPLAEAAAEEAIAAAIAADAIRLSEEDVEDDEVAPANGDPLPVEAAPEPVKPRKAKAKAPRKAKAKAKEPAKPSKPAKAKVTASARLLDISPGSGYQGNDGEPWPTGSTGLKYPPAGAVLPETMKRRLEQLHDALGVPFPIEPGMVICRLSPHRGGEIVRVRVTQIGFQMALPEFWGGADQTYGSLSSCAIWADHSPGRSGNDWFFMGTAARGKQRPNKSGYVWIEDSTGKVLHSNTR